MVIPRLSREHHMSSGQQHQFQQQQHCLSAQPAVFKVPTTSSSQLEAMAKRKLGEAFSADETMLSLSCGVKQPRPKGAKLTIFYAGSVNVFDNVPEETAKALMTLAASKTLKSPPAAAAAAKNTGLNCVNSSVVFGGSSSSESCSNSSCCLSLADITTENNKVYPAAGKNSTTEILFPVLQQADTNVSNSSSKPSTSLASPPVAVKETTTTTTATAAVAPNPRMTLPGAWVLGGLPQARRNSVQRFLQTRRGKHVMHQQDGPAN